MSMTDEEFTCRHNISRFTDQLEGEYTPEKRGTLLRLLVEEEDRYASYSAAHDFIQRQITDLDGRIVKQHAIVNELKAAGSEITNAAKLLKNMTDIRDVCAQYSERLFKNIIRP